MRDYIRRFSVVFLLLHANASFALVSEIFNYVKQYKIGIDYTSSHDSLALSYQTDAAGSVPKSCTLVASDSSKMRCTVAMPAGKNSASGFGLFLQHAFKKQGFWYFDYDVGFGGRYLSGEVQSSDESKDGLPLRNAKFSLGAFVTKPYIEFGITPDKWPDLLISVGPALQVAAGTMTINDKSEKVVAGTSSYSGLMSLWHGFLEVELVLKRFAGDGAFSLFFENDYTGGGEGTKIYPKGIDNMSDFKGSFSHSVGGMAYGFGLKLVTPWP